ncbi:MAG TPA: glycosyltransferase family 39 protein [Planctomycetota bacterium]|nr:glycosyltransferase family 39 protein [Planctomycetota bacterium]
MSGLGTAMRALAAAVGLALLAWAPTVDVRKADPSGGVTPEAFVAWASGVAILAGAAAAGRGARPAAAATAFFAGGAAQLGLTQPLWLEHLEIRGHEIGVGWNRVFVAVIAAQAVVTAALLRGRVRAWIAGARALGPARRWAPAAALFVASSAHACLFVPAGYYRSLATQVVVAGALCALDLATLVAFATEGRAPRAGVVAGMLRPDDVDPPPGFARRAAPYLLAAFAVATSATLAHRPLETLPHVPDELAYLFQAECYARGRLDAPRPPFPEAFEAYCVDVDATRWFAATPPGWPAVLALGVRFGAPWAVNPLLSGLAVLLLHAWVRRAWNRRAADLAALLLATSPWFLYLGASYMTHQVSLVCLLAGLLGVEEARRRRAAWPAALAGLALGWLFLVRSLDGLLLGGLVGLRALGVGAPRAPWRASLALATGFLVVAPWILPWNARYTGDPSVFPINAYVDRLWYPGANRLGFGEDVGNPPKSWRLLDPYPGHGARDVALNTNQNLYTLDVELHGWPIGSLAAIACAVCLRRRTRPFLPIERYAILTAAVLWAGYSLYWFSGGTDFGPRYWYLMLPSALLLGAGGVRRCVAAFAAPRAGASDAATSGDAARRVAAALVALVAFGVFVFVPWRGWRRYVEYRGFHSDYARLARSPELEGALVFVETAPDATSDRDSARVLTSPFFTSADPAERRRPVFARSLGPDADRALSAALPERPVVRLRGRSLSKSGRVERLDR